MSKSRKILALTSIALSLVLAVFKGLKYSDIPQFIFEYEKNDSGGITITEYMGEKSDIIIPDTIGKLPVTEIGYIGNNQKIKSVTIPDSVEKISESAFYRCENLKYVNIPESVEYIGAEAFFGTPFEESLGNDDFIIFNDKILYKYNGNSDNVIIPDGVTSICNGVFSGNNLINIQIPESVEYIGRAAFNKCENLKSIDIPENVKVLKYAVFCDCKSLSEISLPDGLEIIETKVFQNCTSLENISIPDKITEIPESSFQECCSLKEVNFPDSLKTIGDRAFQNCTSLEYINFPDGLETIGNDAFHTTALKEITLPDSVSVLGNDTFRECTSVEKIKLSSGLKIIPIECFDSCTSLTEIEIPEGVETIDMNAFQNNSSLRFVRLPDGLKNIELNAFANSDILCVFIPDSVEYFNRQAFLNDTTKSPVTLMYTKNCKAEEDLKMARAWRVWDDYCLHTVNSRDEAEELYWNNRLEFNNQN